MNIGVFILSDTSETRAHTHTHISKKNKWSIARRKKNDQDCFFFCK